MSKLTFSILRIVVYAVVVMAGFALAYLSIGDPIARMVMGFGGSADTADLAKNILSMCVGFGLGELAKRWLQRRFSE